MATNLSIEQIKRLREALLFRESTGNYSKINKLGYVGGYQFGAQALETLGYLKKGSYVKSKNKAVQNPKNWTGKNNVTNLNDFLKNSKVQDKAFEENLNFNFKSLNQKGIIDKTTPPEETAGFLAASHLIGVNSIDKQGLFKKDANKVAGIEYFNLGKKVVSTPPKVKSTVAQAVESLIPSANAEETPRAGAGRGFVNPPSVVSDDLPISAGAGRGFVNPPSVEPSFEDAEEPSNAQSQFRQSELAFDRNKSLRDLQYPARITEPIQVVPNVQRERIPEVVTDEPVYRDNEIKSKTFMGEPVAPQNIWRDAEGNPILDRWGGYIYSGTS